jgi:hypothetical protein
MLEYVWICGNSKLGSGCQQHSNNRRLMMYGSDFGFIYRIHELRNLERKLTGNYRNISLPIVCSVQTNCSISYFSLLDKSSMVNDVPENDNFCLNPGSSWRCGLWSPHSSPYSLQVLGQSYYFQTRVIS